MKALLLFNTVNYTLAYAPENQEMINTSSDVGRATVESEFPPIIEEFVGFKFSHFEAEGD